MSKKRLAQAILAATGVGGATVIGRNIYKAHQRSLEEAEKELDPIETTLDGAEKYVLDPADSILDNITPAQALAGLATIGAVGAGGKYLYNRLTEDDKKGK